ERPVLAEWSGLGYYARARNLHRAARAIAVRGAFPRTLEGWRDLPGVGAYTAAAVASISFGVPEPVVDGNVVRVLCRFHGLRLDPKAPATLAKVRALARPLVPARNSGDHNQALMELGALVCTPRAPRCGACPLRGACRAAKGGKPEAFPRAPRRPEPRTIHLVAVHRVEQISGDLPHPIAVRSDVNTCDLHGARLQFHREEHHVPDRPEHPQRLDAEEIARVERLPVAFEKAAPAPLAVAFRRRFDAGFRQYGRHRRAADLDLQLTQRVANPRVAPPRIVARKLEDKLADVGYLAWPAHLGGLGAVVLLCGQLAKPGEDRLRAHDLAAAPAFLGRQLLALQRQAASVLGAEVDPRLAGCRREGFLENADFLLQVVELPRHPLVDRVRDHREDELEGRRQHRGEPRLPVLGRLFKPTRLARSRAKLAALAFRTPRGRRDAPARTAGWARNRRGDRRLARARPRAR